ncbi:MarR family winged helix-turn-helix transcriptional regulator [Uliginosibacterium aquaticum]|uniref:Winged helix-turn-helix transcriptional regulator n=1 Tax=Uliginosibacterium aquaticum TaxID=2731212 RepID=A0ABX2IAV7_9RHOO|nr:MarR family winged helix-turn-helix transcriptional regulator [Uliginosibacterium aquaticum]NSL53491.1 winged helix-turn-helix transcriptional regulator [Uliginosibacterium aquaticum]
MSETLPGDPLRLEQQLCFPLYAASRLVTRLYQPLLEPLGLTYPQYIVLMILWEESPCSVSRIGERALLASNTLTPLLKRLEQQGLVQRSRAAHDERVVTIALTEAGQALRRDCACVPAKLYQQVGYPLDEARQLKAQLDTLLARLASLPPG